MKKNLLTLATILTVGFFTNNASAQTKSSEKEVNVGATLIKPMTLTVLNGTSGINFGTINVISGAATTAVVSPKTGLRTGVSSTGVVDGAAAVSVASYAVTGSNNRAYTLSYPSTSITVTEVLAAAAAAAAVPVAVPATAKMTVDDFTVSFNGADDQTSGVSALVNGLDNFKIGATLNVLGTELEGVYAGTFTISVDYN